MRAAAMIRRGLLGRGPAGVPSPDPPSSPDHILLEDDSDLLLEDGSLLLKE